MLHLINLPSVKISRESVKGESYYGLFLECSCNRALVVALFYALTLVVLFFAAPNAYDYFCKPLFADENLKRHNGKAGFFASLAKPGYLFFGKQQLAVAASRMVVVRTVEILGDVHVLEPHLAIGNEAKAVGQRAFALS